METFYTIQGEGYHTGAPAFFIRLGGCDVGCPWCDVKESWDASAHPMVPVEVLAQQAQASGSSIVVVSGGEPAMYDLSTLTSALRKAKLQTHLETSGVYPLTGEWHWVTFSPKKMREPHPSVYALASELKVVVYHASDLEWAKEHASRVRAACRLYLQPEWSKREQMVPLILDFLKHNSHWRLSLQTHKYIGVD